MPSIDSLKFETTGWKYLGEREPGRMRVWETADGDAVALYFFGIPPDLPAKTANELSAKYASSLVPIGGKLLNAPSAYSPAAAPFDCWSRHRKSRPD